MNVHQFQRLQALAAPSTPLGDPAELNALLESLEHAALSPLQRALVLQAQGQWQRRQGDTQAALRSWKESLNHSFTVRVGLDWLELVVLNGALGTDDELVRICQQLQAAGAGRALERSVQQLIDTLPLRQQRLAVVERLERLRCMGSLTRQRVLAASGRE